MADAAVIGVGLVGTALVERLLAGGLTVVAYDRRAEARASCRATVADSARQATELANIIVLSLPDSDAVESVVNEISIAAHGKIIVDTSTGDPERTAALGARLYAAGVGFVDATIVGSSRQVRAGEVVVLAGGRAEDVSNCAPLFALFATRWFHAGPTGHGTRMKLVVNLVLGLHRAVLAEGLAFTRGLGLDLALTLDILRSSAAYSRVMDNKGPKMIAGDYTPEGRLQQHLKDVGLMLAAAEHARVELPLSIVHRDLLGQLVERGLGELDNSAIYNAFVSE